MKLVKLRNDANFYLVHAIKLFGLITINIPRNIHFYLAYIRFQVLRNIHFYLAYTRFQVFLVPKIMSG